MPQGKFGSGELRSRSAPRIVLAPSMARQELTADAVKDGALSRMGATIDIAWNVEPDEAGSRLRLRWQESLNAPLP